MTREEAREYILSHATDYLERDKSKKGFVCPLCQSGSGKNGTGITENKQAPGHYTCWAGCFSNADIIDIIGKVSGATDYNEKLAEACRVFGVTIDSPSAYSSRSTAQEDFAPEYQNHDKTEQYTHNSIHTPTYTQAEQEDYTDFFLQANTAVDQTDYWKKRGLSRETVDRFKLGFVAEWRHPKAPNAPVSPRLIIPTGRGSYLARDTRAEIPAEQKAYSKSKVGSIQLFNKKALQNATKPIFIVEGEIDALSIIEVGGEAVALGTTTKCNALIELLKAQAPSQPLIIALDNDKAGQKAGKELTEGLQGLGIPCYIFNPCENYKDANEALQKDRESLTIAVAEAEHLTDEKAQEQREEEREKLQREAVIYSMDSFLADIRESASTPYIPTGFTQFDLLLDGGLYPGLYVVGAVSSLGKTTFVLQIADNIARAGHNVLIFSLEMARNELIAKSISRLTAIEDLKSQTTSHAKTTRGIMTGTRYIDYSKEERELINNAIETYKGYAKNIYISEGVGNIGVEQIREKVEAHTRITGKAPIVIIDYLQILAPYSERMTDKQNTDKAVLELKRLSRDYKISIIGISSFNRDNYTAPVNLASFKESGAIEYSSDVLLALQYDGMDYEEGETEKNRDKRIRELIKGEQAKGRDGRPQKIQLKILKNRNGSKGDCLIKFYPMFNYFTEEDHTIFEEIKDDDDLPWKPAPKRF